MLLVFSGGPGIANLVEQVELLNCCLNSVETNAEMIDVLLKISHAQGAERSDSEAAIIPR